MPLCTLHLLALDPTTPTPIQTFLSTLHSANLSPLVISRVIRWIVLPTKISTEHLLAQNIHWDLLLILPTPSPTLPSHLEPLIQHHWSVTAGVPSRLLQDFPTKNRALLHPDPASVPPLEHQSRSKETTSSSQHLELGGDLNAWIDNFTTSSKEKVGKGAVSMFNLLSFHPGKKSQYIKYGSAFADSIGSRHGGLAKIVGGVTHVNGAPTPKDKSGKAEEGEAWDEIAVAHYPSILHFRDMLASADYQDVNRKFRVGSLLDTCILMTSEIEVEEVGAGDQGRGAAKL
ncbi:hypothetical protein BDW02DRAFT_607024 [Decorospora gaudefroyi]|uniref:EthD domain-containing protein n=1 Tax=Decorospora gaudefroyi TaxID=184978 RepID=A0A6A5KCW3_9PLEO|nr:hypothetical protein BDW02DRAFT_607024 [Decorospora gaudefroyi]